jgi:hypothetical protein
MLLAPEEHAPQARCDTCGSPEIDSVCHHCGKCLCRKHGRRAVDAAGRPVSREFEDLGFDGKHVGVYHCDEHDHAVKRGLLIGVLAGGCVAVAGAIVLTANIVAGAALLGAGLVAAAGFYLAHRRRLAEARRVRPPLPVAPNMDWVGVQERITGKICLKADGTYESSADPASGMVEMAMTATRRDQARLRVYRAKYGLAADDPVEFSAGSLVFGGEVGLTYENGHEDENRLSPGSAGLAFRGEASGHPLFSIGRGPSAGRWTIRLPYRLQQVRAPGSIPLAIVPSLVPGLGRRTLQVELEWSAFGAKWPQDERKDLEFRRFEQIKLIVPGTAWGNVQRVEPPSAVISKSEDGCTQTIQWRLLSPTEEDTGRTVLKIRFEKPVRQQDIVRGNLRASFRGTLSGITGVRTYWPIGGRAPQQPEAGVALEAEVGFTLSLNRVRYQAVRILPDGDSAIAGAIAGARGLSGVIPDHRTVMALTKELTEDDYYVKRVTGHPPRGGGHANLTNRVWDIAGRKYNGVCPVDFHITITGEEQHRASGIYPNAGRASVRLAVRGSFVDNEMKEDVEKVWDELFEKVKAVLRANRTPAAGLGGYGPPQGDGWVPPPAEPPPWP